MKKTVKIITITLMVVMILAMVANCVFATVDPATFTGTDPNASKLTSVGNQIIGLIRLIGSMIAVAVLVVLGIKYMMGSAEEKAEYKKTMIPYLIGAILIFAATWIASAIYQFANGLH